VNRNGHNGTSELSEARGVDLETIRYYERTGLMPKPEKPGGQTLLAISTDRATTHLLVPIASERYTLPVTD
jgi:hypothetical protein